MGTASARKRRKHKAIDKSSSRFSTCIKKKNYESAASIVYQTSLMVGGSKGIESAMSDANSFIRRKSLKRGL